MATKKDLVEAYSFSRRRLVTAFLSGAPGGREVEPARPGRTVVGGLALAVLVVAGAAIASVLAARTGEDWNKVGLVVSQQTSAQYVILKQAKHPTLIPVINVTSAQLILGADVKPTYVDQSVIENQTPGQPIGIFGAPQLLPQPAQFINQGWTSCTDDGLGMSLDISRTERTTAQSGRGAIVKTVDPQTNRPTYYVIAESSVRDGADRRTYAYPLRKGGRLDTALEEIGLDDEVDAVAVPEAWVRLFPVGGSLDASSFAIPDFGQTLPDAVGRYLPSGTTVGQYYESDQPDQPSYVFTDDGKVVLDPFALAVYKQTVWGTGKQRAAPTPITGQPDPALPAGKQIFDDASWPNTALKPVNGQLCAQLDVHADEKPKVFLRSDPTSSAAAPQSSTPGAAPSFGIDRGQGAYVLSGDWDDTTSTSRVVVDARGTVYTLNGDDTIAKLGYDSVAPPLVPDSWIKLLTRGVALSTNGALCPPFIPADAAPSASSSADPSASTAPSASASAGTAPGAAPVCQDPVS